MPVDGLTAYGHVADVQRSIDFYRRLGLEPRNRHESGGKLVWAFVVAAADNPAGAGARLMPALADGAIDPSAQGVLWGNAGHRLRRSNHPEDRTRELVAPHDPQLTDPVGTAAAIHDLVVAARTEPN